MFELQYILPRLNTHVDAGEIIRFISVTRSPLNPPRLLLSLPFAFDLDRIPAFFGGIICRDIRVRESTCMLKQMNAWQINSWVKLSCAARFVSTIPISSGCFFLLFTTLSTLIRLLSSNRSYSSSLPSFFFSHNRFLIKIFLLLQKRMRMYNMRDVQQSKTSPAEKISFNCFFITG